MKQQESPLTLEEIAFINDLYKQERTTEQLRLDLSRALDRLVRTAKWRRKALQ